MIFHCRSNVLPHWRHYTLFILFQTNLRCSTATYILYSIRLLMCVCTPKAEVQKMLQLPLDFNSTSITESSWWHHPLMTAVRNQIKPKFFIFLQRRVPVGAEALDCPQTSAPSPPGPCPALMDLQRLHCLSGRSLCSPLHRRCFVPLHNLLPSLQASPRTSCSHSPGESSAVWLHASLWGTSDRPTPHVTNAIRGNMQLLHSLLPRVARQGQFVTEASPLSPESWWYLQVSLSLPPSQELACGIGCPEAPGGWGGGGAGRERCTVRENQRRDNHQERSLLWFLEYHSSNHCCSSTPSFISVLFRAFNHRVQNRTPVRWKYISTKKIPFLPPWTSELWCENQRRVNVILRYR